MLRGFFVAPNKRKKLKKPDHGGGYVLLPPNDRTEGHRVERYPSALCG